MLNSFDCRVELTINSQTNHKICHKKPCFTGVDETALHGTHFLGLSYCVYTPVIFPRPVIHYTPVTFPRLVILYTPVTFPRLVILYTLVTFSYSAKALKIKGHINFYISRWYRRWICRTVSKKLLTTLTPCPRSHGLCQQRVRVVINEADIESAYTVFSVVVGYATCECTKSTYNCFSLFIRGLGR